MIREARAIFAARHLPLMWTLDPEAEPSDFALHLAKHGIIPDPHGAESQVMVMPIDATVQSPPIEGLEIRDALVDLDTFRMADGAAAEAFGQEIPPPPRSGGGSGWGASKIDYIAMQERRRLNFRAAGNRYWLLATVHGEPAGTAGMSLYPPEGAILQGGSVRAPFRGRGIYRAMVAARQEIARRARVGGLTVWGGDMSAPILTGLGFQTVGWRRFYLDTSTA